MHKIPLARPLPALGYDDLYDHNEEFEFGSAGGQSMIDEGRPAISGFDTGAEIVH